MIMWYACYGFQYGFSVKSLLKSLYYFSSFVLFRMVYNMFEIVGNEA